MAISQRHYVEKEKKKKRETSCFSPNQDLEEDPAERLAQVPGPGTYI